MKLVIASDTFKDSLSSSDIAEIISSVVQREYPHAQLIPITMADGGEGSVATLLAAIGGSSKSVEVMGPCGEPTLASWGLLAHDTAIIEMAQASGLPLVPTESRDPRFTTTFGTGELIRAALNAKAKDIILAVGGSATNDGGMGALSALGVRFSDASGATLTGAGNELIRVASVDLSSLDPRLVTTHFTVICDVDNPLLGPQGATAVFAPQKGATALTVEDLELGMQHYASILCAATGIDYDSAVNAKGSGAAGGLAFACSTVLGATLKPGIEIMLDTIGFDALIEGADLVITGEGRLDMQTEHGKVVWGVSRRCRKAGVPCVAIVGSSNLTDAKSLGLTEIIAITPPEMPLQEALSHSRELYTEAVHHMLAKMFGDPSVASPS